MESRTHLADVLASQAGTCDHAIDREVRVVVVSSSYVAEQENDRLSRLLNDMFQDHQMEVCVTQIRVMPADADQWWASILDVRCSRQPTLSSLDVQSVKKGTRVAVAPENHVRNFTRHT